MSATWDGLTGCLKNTGIQVFDHIVDVSALDLEVFGESIGAVAEKLPFGLLNCNSSMQALGDWLCFC